MTKLCLLMMLGLGIAALASAAPYKPYNPDIFRHFLRYDAGEGTSNDNENNNNNNYRLQEQNKQKDSDESSSEENSQEESESEGGNEGGERSSSVLRFSSIASDYSSFVNTPETDPPLVQAAATTIPIATTVAVKVSTAVPTTVAVEVPTTLAPLQTTETPIDRGDAPAPGVNSPQVNVITTESSKTTVKIADTESNTTADPTPTPVKPTCMTSCPLNVDTVCGSDGVTYPSRCVFDAVMCRDNTQEIVIVSLGECQPKQLKPDNSNLRPGVPAGGAFMP